MKLSFSALCMREKVIGYMELRYLFLKKNGEHPNSALA